MDENYYKTHRITKRTDIDIAKYKSVENIYKKITDNLGFKEYGELTYINTIYNLAEAVKDGSFDKNDFMYMLDQAAKTVSTGNKEVIRKMLEKTPYDKSKFFNNTPKYKVGQLFYIKDLKYGVFDYSNYNGFYKISEVLTSENNTIMYKIKLKKKGSTISVLVTEEILDKYGHEVLWSEDIINEK